MTLRERRGEPDRGLTAAAPLRCRFHGHAGEPGRQDVLVAPLSAVNIEIVENQAVRAAVAATLDDLREAVTILEETEQTARRVLGGANPLVGEIETSLREARAALAARDVEALGDALGALGAA